MCVVHGGAFNAGSKNQISLASMVSGAPVKYVAVGVNYRVSLLECADFLFSPTVIGFS
jgi:carboxylesterase type B